MNTETYPAPETVPTVQDIESLRTAIARVGIQSAQDILESMATSLELENTANMNCQQGTPWDRIPSTGMIADGSTSQRRPEERDGTMTPTIVSVTERVLPAQEVLDALFEQLDTVPAIFYFWQMEQSGFCTEEADSLLGDAVALRLFWRAPNGDIRRRRTIG